MSFDEFIQQVKGVSPAKREIIKALWGDDAHPFPKQWVTGKTIYELINQTDYGKRIRELRDHSRLDITSGHYNGVPAHRLESTAIGEEQPREYLSKTEKLSLFNSFRFTCQGCGKVIPNGQKGLQADHRIPLSRGGSNAITNWQPLCVSCNVGKRRACQGCNDDCIYCAWAFQQKIGRKIALTIPEELMEKLKLIGYDSQDKIEKLCINTLSNFTKTSL